MRLMTILFICAGLILSGGVSAESMDLVVVTVEEGVIDIAYDSNNAPPLIVFRGQTVGHYAEHGGLDCDRTENRPICVSLNTVLEAYSGRQPPEIIIVDGGEGVQLLQGSASFPPPIVVVNGRIVAGG